MEAVQKILESCYPGSSVKYFAVWICFFQLAARNSEGRSIYKIRRHDHFYQNSNEHKKDDLM